MWKLIKEDGNPEKWTTYPVWIYCSANNGYIDYLMWDGAFKRWKNLDNTVFNENEKVYVESYFVIPRYK